LMMDAGRSTTSPAAIWSTRWEGSTRMDMSCPSYRLKGW
jgi:hypothetical protein